MEPSIILTAGEFVTLLTILVRPIALATVIAGMTARLWLGVFEGPALSVPARVNSHAHPVQFGLGERLTYDVSFGRIHVGSGEMAILRTDTVSGHPVWQGMLAISGGIPMFRVRDTVMSWFDTATFVSRRFVQHLHEGRYRASRDFRIDPERRTYAKNDGLESPSVYDPLDDVSFIYFTRTLPLDVGQRYEFHRYFRPEANPVIIRVIRRERLTVPAGTFNAVLIEPEITTTDGMFSRDGAAQLWLSDDSARVLLQLKSRLSFGSINLYLSHITPGRTQ